jgi:hypothetical protein
MEFEVRNGIRPRFLMDIVDYFRYSRYFWHRLHNQTKITIWEGEMIKALTK